MKSVQSSGIISIWTSLPNCHGMQFLLYIAIDFSSETQLLQDSCKKIFTVVFM